LPDIFWYVLALLTINTAPLHSHTWWVSWIVGPIFIWAGFSTIYSTARNSKERELFPVRWTCQACKAQKKPATFKATNDLAMDLVRANHRRTTHLMEP